ncbi:sulfatase [Mesoplasma photuris]|uniref:sulfatase n=1 Tax=Mesoplasma photuris TaxID=217731 RepID=UPI0004E0D233|nr:sulfatase [Mesoplasma photuris]
MKAVMIMFDTLTRKFLPNYGNDWVKAPNFERLGKKTITFENFYAGSMPCMPARREIHTGKYNFLHRGWGPLEPFDKSIFDLMTEKGIYTHLITDHSHYFEDGGATYHNRYSTWEGYRGQEGDRWVPRDSGKSDISNNSLNKKGISWEQHFANRERMQEEKDYPSVLTMESGLDFIKRHKDLDDWFVQIETFDPHEPFLVPDEYRVLYEKVISDDLPFFPLYQHLPEGYDAKQVEQMRKEYAALITMVDKYLGKILDYFDENDLWKDTMLIVNTDHGFLLGEHDFIGKNIMPFFDEIIHTPFFLHVPEYAGLDGTRIDAVSQTIDIAPTILEYFKLERKEGYVSNGKSLLNLIKDEELKNHDIIVFGEKGGFVSMYDGKYIFIKSSVKSDNLPVTLQTLSFTNMRGFISEDDIKTMKLIPGSNFSNQIPMVEINLSKNHKDTFKFGDFLFDLENDPEQKNNIKDKKLIELMNKKLKQKLIELEVPNDEFKRLGL